MTVLLVDWLGRGGIAQMTEAWAIELRAAGVDTAIVTRPGRELGQGSVPVRYVPDRRTRLLAHVALVKAAVAAICELRPSAVVLQNHVIPPVEAMVDRAARRLGSAVVRVVHDHRLHSRWAGTQIGVHGLLQRADLLLAHTEYVGEQVAAAVGREVEILPLPVQVGVLAHDVPPVPERLLGPGDLALHFGVVHREYKGTDVILALAAGGVPGWRLGVVGSGAPVAPGLATVEGFVAPGVLVAAVGASAASLLPYRFATQSGAIVLAQALGSVPIANAVGGLSEQISDGRTGILLPPNAGVGAWQDALSSLDEPTRQGIADRAAAHVWAAHGRFCARIAEIVGAP